MSEGQLALQSSSPSPPHESVETTNEPSLMEEEETKGTCCAFEQLIISFVRVSCTCNTADYCCVI